MSIVYLAMNEKVNKQWAIKEVLKKDYRNFEMDKKEIEMMKRLKHPNLPAIVDVIEGVDGLLIVMDYIEGQSLEDIVRSYGAQRQEMVISWAKQLCSVLCYLHGRTPPIIYRDMKPSNIILRPDGKLILIDFGAAREYKEETFQDTVLLGTRGYAAPEQYRSDGQSDERTDLYSLGVTLFRLFTGAEPQELCPVRELVPEISPGIEKILLKCTRVNKKERYKNAAELLEAFERYWEYDEHFWKKQKKKLFLFFIPTICGVLFLFSTIYFSIKEFHVKKYNYETFLTEAQRETEDYKAIEIYQKAIGLDPRKEDAYLQLLENVFLKDELLSLEEEEVFRNILITCYEGQGTNEELLRTNAKGFAEVSYKLGITYFYKYQGNHGKKYAKVYFQEAAALKKLEEKKQKRAERLALISGYYDQIGNIDAAGDRMVSYGDYWRDLMEVSEGNLVEEDNARTALVVYEEVIGQILSRTTSFSQAGITKEEMIQKLDQIEKHLKEDFAALEIWEKEKIAEEIAALQIYIKKAKNIVTSVYEQAE